MSAIAFPSQTPSQDRSASRMRTVPGYRTAHATHVRSFRERPTSLDAIVESVGAQRNVQTPRPSAAEYDYVYTGIRTDDGETLPFPRRTWAGESLESGSSRSSFAQGSSRTDLGSVATASANGHSQPKKMNKLRKTPPRARKLSSQTAKSSPVRRTSSRRSPNRRVSPVRRPSPMRKSSSRRSASPQRKRTRTLSFGWRRFGLRKRKDSQASTAKVATPQIMEGYLIEPFAGAPEPQSRGERPLSYVSTTSVGADSFYTARASTMAPTVAPESRPMSMVSWDSNWDGARMSMVSYEDGDGGLPVALGSSAPTASSSAVHPSSVLFHHGDLHSPPRRAPSSKSSSSYMNERSPDFLVAERAFLPPSFAAALLPQSSSWAAPAARAHTRSAPSSPPNAICNAASREPPARHGASPPAGGACSARVVVNAGASGQNGLHDGKVTSRAPGTAVMPWLGVSRGIMETPCEDKAKPPHDRERAPPAHITAPATTALTSAYTSGAPAALAPTAIGTGAEARGRTEKGDPKMRTNTMASTTSTTTTSSTSTAASSASAASSAMASTAASSASCTSGSMGWRSSVGSTPPTSPGLSDASHFKGYFQGEAAPALRERDEEMLSEESVREKAKSLDGHSDVSGGRSTIRRAKLSKRRPVSLVVDTTKERPGERRSTEGRKSLDDAAPSRARSILGIKIGHARSKSKDAAGRRSREMERVEEDKEFLPPVRPPSPLWAGSSGKIPSPYARASYPDYPSVSASLPTNLENATDALASLAFTGNTSALSSSALAALTSRLSHRASSEALHSASSTPPSPKKHKKARSELGHGETLPREKKGKAPEWSAAFAVLPVAVKEKSREEMFDPYAEVRIDTLQDEEHRRKGLQKRPSLAFFKLDRGKERERESRRMDKGKGKAREHAMSPVPETRKTIHTDTPTDIDELGAVVMRRLQSSPNANAMKRWTIAMADVPDEVLVQELEKLRMESRRESQRGRRRDAEGKRTEEDWKSGEAAEESESESEEHHEDDVSHASHSHSTSHSNAHSHRTSIPAHPSDDAEWKVARRALLSCRELVRTERNYQASLRQLLAGQTQTAPPPLVLSYVPALLKASEALLCRFEDDPSTWGVSVAFVAVEEEAEAAFVGWAGVVGEIVLSVEPPVDDLDQEKEAKLSRRLTRASRNSSLSNVGEVFGVGKKSKGVDGANRKRGVSFHDQNDGVGPTRSPPESASACASPRVPPPRTAQSTPNTVSKHGDQSLGMFTAALGTGLAYSISPVQPPSPHEGITKNPNGSGTLSKTLGAWRTKFMSSPNIATQGHHTHSHYHAHQGAQYQSVPGSPRSTSFYGETRAVESRRELKAKEKLPSVRELAVLPVQRVMRYVLQYRDLLQSTPVESPSRGLVERALESAMRIAERCDRAQGNAAFLRG
ncbi:hypothetical protein PsYK624_157840 [Phanerochaete sordida]|uniref:DH domain-containing protein n=1 Tax=Phanerochaete sordida TaxID=48140 RepID=A0A9P3GR30_9APHY|nr:hypothetical protein PsYK624_157840 [Phanerochaete sordida]